MQRLWVCLFVWLTPAIVFASEPSADISYGWILTKTILLLIAICALAFATLKWGSKFIQRSHQHDQFRVIARLPIEPRRSVIVVKVGDQNLVLGSSESGFSTLATLTPEEAEALVAEPEKASKTFSEVLEEAT